MSTLRGCTAPLLPSVIVVLAALLLAACSGMPLVARESRSNAFDAAVTTYGKLLRWGYFDEAAGYLRTPDGTVIEADLARAARYRVTGYNVVSKILADTGRAGRVVATIEYYEIDSGVLHALRDAQEWWYDDEQKRWYLASPLPAFGAEPASPAAR